MANKRKKITGDINEDIGAKFSEKYSGNFSKDVFNGQGVYIDEKGNLYEGLFKNGKIMEGNN